MGVYPVPRTGTGNLGQGEEGVEVGVVEAGPDLGQPVAEAVGEEDAAPEVEQEAQHHVLQPQPPPPQAGGVCRVDRGEVVPDTCFLFYTATSTSNITFI